MSTAPIQRIENPFGGQVVAAPTSGAPVEIEQQRAVAEAQAAIMMAKMAPRDPVQAMDRILNACTRPKLAEKAVYAYVRGGAEVNGPSIRLAEAIAQNWGNLQFGIRELDQRPGVSTVEAYCWDMETNVRQNKVFQVKHERSTKKGRYALEDQRDIYEMVANNGARRLRACILGVVPGDVIEAAQSQCEATLKASADTSPETIQKMLDKFYALGVTKEMVEKRIQRRVESIQPAQVISLRGIYNSIKDGMSVTSDWFEVLPSEPVAESKTASIKEQLKKEKAPEAPKPEEEPTQTQIVES